MHKLIQNEIHKLFAQKKMLVFFAILLAMSLMMGFVIYSMQNSPNPETKMNNTPLSGQLFPIMNLSGLIQMFAIFAIVMIAEMITEEYTTGTLKLSLLHPVTRGRLITAKVLALWIATIILLIFTLIALYIIGTAFFGWGNQFIFLDKTYSMGTGFLLTFAAYLLTSLPVMSFGLVVLFASLFLNGSGAVIGLGLGFFFAQTITSQISPKIAPYLIASYNDWWSFLYTGQWKQVTYSFIIFAVYGGLSYLLSLRFFKKKDLLH